MPQDCDFDGCMNPAIVRKVADAIGDETSPLRGPLVRQALGDSSR